MATGRAREVRRPALARPPGARVTGRRSQSCGCRERRAAGPVQGFSWGVGV